MAQRINLRFDTAARMPSPDVFVISTDAFQSALHSDKYSTDNDVVLVIEVISPSNLRKIIDSKVALYSSFGIDAWVVSPKRQEIDVFRKSKRETYTLAQSITLPSQLGGKKISLTGVFDVMS